MANKSLAQIKRSFQPKSKHLARWRVNQYVLDSSSHDTVFEYQSGPFGACVCLFVCVSEERHGVKKKGVVWEVNIRERSAGGGEVYINQAIRRWTVGVAPNNSLFCQGNPLHICHPLHCGPPSINPSPCRIAALFKVGLQDLVRSIPLGQTAASICVGAKLSLWSSAVWERRHDSVLRMQTHTPT